jgi:hypothetical protein
VHLCTDFDLFVGFISSGTPESICSFQDSALPTLVLGSGSVTLQAITLSDKVVDIPLADVMYAEGLTSNIISTSLLYKQLHMWMHTGTGDVFLEGLATALFTVKLLDGLYFLPTPQPPAITSPLGRVVASASGGPEISMDQAHLRFGHIPARKIKELEKNSHGFRIVKGSTLSPCVACHLGHSKETPYRSSPLDRAAWPNQRLHIDTMIGTTPVGLNGETHSLLIVDEFTREKEITHFSVKSVAGTRLHHSIRRRHSPLTPIKLCILDNGKELNIDNLKVLGRELGFDVRTSEPYAHSSNGLVESHIGHLTERGRTMCIGANLPQSLWTYAADTATLLSNLIPSVTLSGLSPYEKRRQFEGVPPQDPKFRPDLSNIRPYGCAAFPHLPPEGRVRSEKFAPRSGPIHYLIGYQGRHVYKLWHPGSNTVTTARHVSFIETQFFDTTEAIGASAPLRSATSLKKSADRQNAQAAPKPAKPHPLSLPAPTPILASAPPLPQPPLPQASLPPIPPHLVLPSVPSPPSSPEIPGADIPAPWLSDSDEDAVVHAGTWRPPFGAPWDPDFRSHDSLPIQIEPDKDLPPSLYLVCGENPPKPHFMPQTSSDITMDNLSTLNPVHTPILDIDTSMENTESGDNSTLGPPSKKTTRRPIYVPETSTAVPEPIQILGQKRKRAYLAYLFFVAKASPSKPSSFPSLNTPIPEPSTYQKAMRSRYSDEWHKASQLQVNQLVEHNTWSLRLPPEGCKPLRGRWVYKVKYDVNGAVACFKARWVVRGDLQREGIDFDDTASAVAHSTVVRMLIALAARYKQKLRHFDFVTAFLNGLMDPAYDIYVEQPHGFVQKDTSGRTLYCLLRKALYGLKQSPLLWYKRLTSYLSDKLGFTPFSADVCLFRHHQTYILIYVDDLLIMAPDDGTIDRILATISSDFNITSLGPVSHFLGMRVLRSTSGGITILQDTYIDKILAEFSFKEGSQRPTLTPMDSAFIIDKAPSPLLSQSDHHLFLRINGSLQWVASLTRPDIAFAVNWLARYSAAPAERHMKAAHRILRYLRSTPYRGIRYGDDRGLELYTDAAYGDDLETRRSTTGFVFMLSGGPILWRSTRQPIVTTSSTEAEYVAASTATQSGIWLGQLLSDFHFPGLNCPLPLYTDSQSAISIAINPFGTKRSKHIEIRWHFLREQIANGAITIEHLAGVDMPADGLTKPLDKVLFLRFIALLGLAEVDVNSPLFI